MDLEKIDALEQMNESVGNVAEMISVLQIAVTRMECTTESVSASLMVAYCYLDGIVKDMKSILASLRE